MGKSAGGRALTLTRVPRQRSLPSPVPVSALPGPVLRGDMHLEGVTTFTQKGPLPGEIPPGSGE